MNTVWSEYIQKTETLYLSRALRFSDVYEEQYKSAFCIDNKLKLLEIGCGPGALTQSLARWYPCAEVVGIDRDSAFIEFASEKSPDIKFMEADATELPFDDNSFDLTISNTVSEHIEPSRFFGEQYRVLKPGGICLVLSARRGIHIAADCIAEQTAFEREIWGRLEHANKGIESKYNVCKYPMDERGLPMAMEEYGFRHISTQYLTINLTPDNPENPKEFACEIINADRQMEIDSIDRFAKIATGLVSENEIAEMKRRINQKYDRRIELYNSGIKQWDTNMSLTMVVRGVKA